jgi:DNA-binding response OmpR family regulator
METGSAGAHRTVTEADGDVRADGPRTVLVVDDEAALLDVVEPYLRDDGFVVVRAGDGPTALERFHRDRPDLVVLDINLPGLSGTDVLRRIRAERNVPVIMLTARVTEVDRVVGLELGADDYVAKPFSPRELVARVRAVLRRSDRVESRRPERSRRVGEIEIDSAAHEVWVSGRPVTLTPTQFRILDALATHVGQTLTRDQLLERVGSDGDVFDRTLDRHIANLRARVERDRANPEYIVTVFGMGYKMVAPA